MLSNTMMEIDMMRVDGHKLFRMQREIHDGVSLIQRILLLHEVLFMQSIHSVPMKHYTIIIIMSFYHVLQSNTSPETFPNNNASSFSTPVPNPYMLEGNWEMALMNIVHSNCIHTFNNERATVVETFVDLTDFKAPMKVLFKFPPFNERDRVIHWYMKAVSDVFGNDVKLDIPDLTDTRFVSWKVERSDMCLLMSRHLAHLFNLLPRCVFSSEDSIITNSEPLGEHFSFNNFLDLHIIVIPLTVKSQTIKVKAAGEKINLTTLMQRFNAHYARAKVASMRQHYNTKVVSIKKINNKTNSVLVLSPALHKALHLPYRGIFYDGWLNASKPPDLNIGLADEWSVTVKEVTEVIPYKATVTHTIPMEPRVLPTAELAIQFLNDMFEGKHVTFSLEEKNIVKVHIDKENITLHLEDTLRDILAFDSNTFKGKGTFTASDSISLTRRIRYLYIYSNIGDMVRIGDTEAPLLAVIPFQPKSCRLVTEKTFQTPMYVPVARNHISQIDIGIFDDAGITVPFTTDGLTSLRIHFRQQS